MATSDNARALRDALSAFATGVTIVTARDADGEAIGMTASSFNSVSMEPPLILWSVTKTAFSGPAFKAASHFAVHVLASDQSALSNTFARQGEDKFSGIAVVDNANRVPTLPDTAARFDCCTWAVYEGGDHWIIVGEVLNFERHKREGLVFCNGGYATANPIRPPAPQHDEATDGDDIDSLLFYQLSRSYRQMAQKVHAAVIECGLTLPEWRILASLHPHSARDLDDLAARTFLEPRALNDRLQSLAADGLCQIQHANGISTALGTAKGAERVAHLMRLSSELEQSALAGSSESDRSTLENALKRIIDNTQG